MTTYYVSSIIGSNQNAGTSASAPLASLQAAEALVNPGDTVEVMNGTYTAPGYGDALDITTSGTASAPITFEAAPGQTPVINSSGGWNAINIEASYIVVEGFTVVGDAANYTLQSALAGYSTGNANLDGNGIAINTTSSVPLPNHITIENNTVYDEPGGGISTEGADYVQILNNVVHNNAKWSAYGNSGISVSTSGNSDTNPGAHIIVSGNLVYDNAQLVPTIGNSTITDGEGIILDTNPNFVSEILVENNTVYSNGSSGIELYLTNNATITGNIVYGNNTESVQAASNAEFFINQSNNNTVTNNTTTAPTPSVADFVLREFQAAWGVVPTTGAGSQFDNWVARIIADPSLESGGMSQALAGTPEFMTLYGTTSATEPASAGFVNQICESLLGIPPGPGAEMNIGLPVWQVLQNFAQSPQAIAKMDAPTANFQNLLLAGIAPAGSIFTLPVPGATFTFESTATGALTVNIDGTQAFTTASVTDIAATPNSAHDVINVTDTGVVDLGTTNFGTVSAALSAGLTVFDSYYNSTITGSIAGDNDIAGGDGGGLPGTGNTITGGTASDTIVTGIGANTINLGATHIGDRVTIGSHFGGVMTGSGDVAEPGAWGQAFGTTPTFIAGIATPAASLFGNAANGGTSESETVINNFSVSTDSIGFEAALWTSGGTNNLGGTNLGLETIGITGHVLAGAAVTTGSATSGVALPSATNFIELPTSTEYSDAAQVASELQSSFDLVTGMLGGHDNAHLLVGYLGTNGSIQIADIDLYNPAALATMASTSDHVYASDMVQSTGVNTYTSLNPHIHAFA